MVLSHKLRDASIRRMTCLPRRLRLRPVSQTSTFYLPLSPGARLFFFQEAGRSRPTGSLVLERAGANFQKRSQTRLLPYNKSAPDVVVGRLGGLGGVLQLASAASPKDPSSDRLLGCIAVGERTGKKPRGPRFDANFDSVAFSILEALDFIRDATHYKRRVLLPKAPRHTPLARKRQRLDLLGSPTTPLSISASPTIPMLPFSPFKFNSDGVVVDNSRADLGVDMTRSGSVSGRALTDRAAMLALDADSHQITNDVRATEQEDKQTKGTYARHVSHYETFWTTTSYARGDNAAGLAAIPAFPITIAKAVIVLQYESTRPQKKRRRKATDDEDDTHEASSVGVSGVKQVTSALEHWRFNNQHLYKEIADAKAGLRVKAFESAAAHKEPECVKIAHSLKAKGSSAAPEETQPILDSMPRPVDQFRNHNQYGSPPGRYLYVLEESKLTYLARNNPERRTSFTTIGHWRILCGDQQRLHTTISRQAVLGGQEALSAVPGLAGVVDATGLFESMRATDEIPKTCLREPGRAGGTRLCNEGAKRASCKRTEDLMT
ncbi:hypothetical protein FB451DRAFT_1193200 [Mycena latifolia]|nr:hypothetical protein FB451DRAFT_1193200 [Mycena latifolia]